MNFQFIICTYNNEEIIEDCLISIKKLNREKSWKFNIMLVDDNSYDSTISVARAHNKDITTIALFDNLASLRVEELGPFKPKTISLSLLKASRLPRADCQVKFKG